MTMFDRGWRQHMEDRTAALEGSVGEMRHEISAFGGKLDKLVEGISDSGDRAAQRAQAVKTELREETDRRAKTWFAFITAGVALLSAIGIIVAALTGPWKEKLETTASGQQADMAAVAAVREVLAQQGAGIGRNQDAMEIAREKNRAQDDQLRQVQHDQAYLAGWLSARTGYPGH